MNISTLYDRSIKMIDDSYSRLLRIWELPRGSISKKIINNHTYYYYQYRDGKKIITKILKDGNLESYKKDINERKRLELLNKKAKEDIAKNIKVISIFNKELSNNLIEEMYAYKFDEIPIKDRNRMSATLRVEVGINPQNDNLNINDYFNKWVHGEIRAREISNYVIKKLSN